MQVTDAMVAKALDAFVSKYGDDALVEPAMRAALTAALAEMWRTDFENAPFMEPVALTLRGRKLPIAVFRHNAEAPWRYLESGRVVEDDLIATHFMPLPAPPKTGGE